MPKDFNFEGSGYKGVEFEQKGMEERNLDVLLKSLSNKRTQKAIEELSKIEPESWDKMSSITKDILSFTGMTSGTDIELLSGIKSTIIDTLETELSYALAPIKNEITGVINNLLSPVMPLLMNISNGIAGAINSWFDFSSTGMWATAGRKYFAGVEDRKDKWEQFVSMTGGGSYTDYVEWLKDIETRNATYHAPTEESSSKISGRRIDRMLRYENSGTTGGTLTPTTSIESSRLGEFE